jgi:hypothetical protein
MKMSNSRDELQRAGYPMDQRKLHGAKETPPIICCHDRLREHTQEWTLRHVLDGTKEVVVVQDNQY